MTAKDLTKELEYAESKAMFIGLFAMIMELPIIILGGDVAIFLLLTFPIIGAIICTPIAMYSAHKHDGHWTEVVSIGLKTLLVSFTAVFPSGVVMFPAIFLIASQNYFERQAHKKYRKANPLPNRKTT